MKSLQLLWMAALRNLGAWCDVCTTRDSKTAASRFEHRGLSFYTITLADFGKDFEKSLDLGRITHDQYPGFARTGGLPRFLGGFLELVFDRRSGQLLESPSIDAIFAIRQLTLMMAKIGLECAPHRKAKAVEGYIQCEMDVKKSDAERTEADYLQFSRLSLLVFARYFDSVERRLESGDIRGRHGPGSTADGLRGNAKFSRMSWTSRLEEVLSAGDHLITRYGMHDLLEHVDFHEPGDEIPVKVTLVPKTQKTPRIIAQEPTHMMYMQQGILEVMLEEFYRDNLLSSLVGFDDQTPNQRLAKLGSSDGSLATLDLSEASDRVSLQHVRYLLAQHPFFGACVEATRSLKARVPGHGVIHLSKFASMGSALTFPMEAFTFLVLVLCGIEKTLKRPLTRSDIQSLRGKVRIYGDDIIVPVEYVTSVISTLEAHGFRVNAGKSFWTGKFRESCGRDYYDGHDVSIVRVRSVLPTSHKHAQEILSTVSTRNLFYKRGMWSVSQWLDDWMWKVLKYYPHVHDESPVIGRYTFLDCLNGDEWRMSSNTHAPVVKGYRVKAQSPMSPLDGEAALLKFFLKRGEDPYEKDHLKRAGRDQAVYLKPGWGPLGIS
jgi:hypothetical protein